MLKTYQSHNCKNTTGQTYLILQENKIEDLYHIKDTWEKEQNIILQVYEWNQTCKDNFSLKKIIKLAGIHWEDKYKVH